MTSVREQIRIIEALYRNGLKHDMTKAIDEYGETFFEDLAFVLEDSLFMPSERYRIFVGITKAYHRIKSLGE
jgi:hypothetical protein